jgi:4-carboxymuconolactone decarboxylase
VNRVPAARREAVAPELRDVFDELVAHRPGGVVTKESNWSTMLYSPEACRRVHDWADYLREESQALSRPIRELAILVTAREHDCQYIWNAHAPSGRKAGLAAALLDALRDRKPLPAVKRDEAAVINYGREFYRMHRVSKGTFQEALEQFGVQGLVELTMVMGFHATLAFNLIAFDINLPEKRTEPLMPV